LLLYPASDGGSAVIALGLDGAPIFEVMAPAFIGTDLDTSEAALCIRQRSVCSGADSKH
jgi:hypothetical protein